MKSNKIDPEIRDLLLDTEEVVISASQDRVAPGGSIRTPNAIYITNKRIIYKIRNGLE